MSLKINKVKLIAVENNKKKRIIKIHTEKNKEIIFITRAGAR